MSEKNVAVVRQAWEAYQRRDSEAALALYNPEIEVDLTGEERVDARVYYGLEGVQEFFRDLHASFGEMKVEVEEWLNAGDQVIAMVRSYGRGKRSRVPVEMLEAHLWTVHDGLLLRLQVFATRAEALEAAGLRE